MEENELGILPSTPLDASKPSKAKLVQLHKEMQRQNELMKRIKRNVIVLAGVRQAMEAALGMEDHKWDMESDYDPDDCPEKITEDDNPLRRLFGGLGGS